MYHKRKAVQKVKKKAMPDQFLRQLVGHQSAINAVRLTHDGSYCMTASEDRTLKLWNPHKTDPNAIQQEEESALCVQTFAGVHGYAVHDVVISQDKSRFASGGEDRSCYLWDVASSRVIRRIQAHQHRTNALAFNTDATVLFTASYDQTVKVWDLRSQNRDALQTLSDFKDSVTAIQLAPEGGKIVASSVDGYVRVYDMRLGCMHADHLGDMVTSVAISDDEKTYLATCMGGTMRLVDLDSGKLLKEYQGHQHNSYKMEAVFHYNAGKQQTVSKVQHQVLCGSEDGSVFHWDLLTAQVVDSSHKVHRKPISSIACHPTQDFFVTASYDGTARCWTSSSRSQR